MDKGITRKLDALGRIVIPKEMRKDLKIEDGERMVITQNSSMICIKKERESCVLCGETKNIITRDEQSLCKSCLKKFCTQIGYR